MSVQFRLGAQDHRVVEDFLLRGSKATSAITLDPKAFRHQQAVAESAQEVGVDVYFEPATERLVEGGYGLEKFPCYNGQPYAIDSLAADVKARGELVAKVLDMHPSFVTHTTAAHFYIDDDRVVHLNIDLAERTLLRTDRPLRAIVTMSNRYGLRHGADVAAEYFRAGIRDVELRLSPFGGDDESIKKIRDGFAIAQAFTDAGLAVVLGQSGNLGQTAYSLGHVEGYSVGVGMLEHVNVRSVISRQKVKPRERTEEDEGGGPTAGVYLPGLAATVPIKVATHFLSHTDLRTRVSCRVGKCATSIRGPLLDRRDHYLHARDAETAALVLQPSNWRATSEAERLRTALDLRNRVNRNYLLDGMNPMRTRTIESLIEDIARARKAS